MSVSKQPRERDGLLRTTYMVSHGSLFRSNIGQFLGMHMPFWGWKLILGWI